MKTTLALLLILILTAGCLRSGTDGPEADSTAPTATGTDGSPAPADTTDPTPGPLGLTVTPPAGPLTNGTWLVQGTIDQAARITLRLVDDDTTDLGGLDADGDWSQEIEVPYGQSTLAVTADDGTSTETAEVPLVRLAEALFQVRYGGYPGPSDSDDTVWMDVDAYPSAPLYEEQGIPHPGHANVHDLMVQWETDTGNEITYGYSDSFGFSVDSINGAGNPVSSSAPPWWCYTVDGETAEMGIMLQPFEPGMTVAWALGTCT